MKKTTITLSLLIALIIFIFSCKKNTTQQNNNSSTNPSTTGSTTGTNSSYGNVTFTAYQKCSCCSQQVKNGANVFLYNSQVDLNNDNFSYYQLTQGTGTTVFSNLTPKKYYYKISGSVTYGNCANVSREVTGNFTLLAGQSLNITGTLLE